MAFKRAIVTAVAPLRILIDGDTVPIPFTPKSLIDPATLAVGDVVHADQSGHRLVVLGRAGGLGLLSGRNLIINSNFMVNQEDKASGASIADNAYILDGWKNVSGGPRSFSWSDTGGVRAFTLVSEVVFGTQVHQPVEAQNLPAGTYTISCSNTAVRLSATTSAATLVSGTGGVRTFTTDGTLDVNIGVYETAGSTQTLTWVKLERGTVATPYQPATYADSLRECMRYYQRRGARGRAYALLSETGFQSSTTEAYIPTTFSTPMRATPTLSQGGVVKWYTPGGGGDATVTLGQSTSESGRLTPAFASTGAGNAPGYLRSDDGSGWLAFDARL